MNLAYKHGILISVMLKVLKRLKDKDSLLPLYVVSFVALIGGLMVTLSLAANNTPSTESERGNISGPAKSITDPNASNNSALQFGTNAGVYSGVFVTSGLLNNFSMVTDFETQAGKPVSIINVFASWANTDGTEKFRPTMMNKIRDHGSIPLFTWEPWDTSVDPNAQPNYQLQDIINGNYDAYITEWALAAKAWGHPFFMRWGHEMNGNWYPWAESINGNNSGQYVAAWRHVHDIFTANNVTNVTWVWCVNTVYNGSTPINTLYPGDNYVDWVSFDSYNRGTNNNLSWRDFDTLIDPTYDQLQTIAPGKPVMIAEYGTVEEGGDKAQWFKDALKHQLKTNYPRIKAVAYFNLNKNGFNNVITTTETARAAYAESIGLSYYASNWFGNLSGTTIQPLLLDALSGADTMPPYASITYPNTSKIKAGQQLHMRANALDRAGVQKVDFYVNGALVCNENLLPYECFWNVPVGVGSQYNINIKAYDQNNNVVNSSATVTSE